MVASEALCCYHAAMWGVVGASQMKRSAVNTLSLRSGGVDSLELF